MADHSDEPPDPGPLEGIRPERREEVRRWLTTTIASCCNCGASVYPTSLRAIDGKSKELGHLDCLSETLGTCEECGRNVCGLDDRESTRTGLLHASCAADRRQRKPRGKR